MKRLRYLANVATLQLDTETCIGCGMCAQVCPHAVFIIEGKKAEIVDRDACMECGACAGNCPVAAITVQAGVGCATAELVSAVTGSEPTCDCSDKACCS